MNYTEFYPSWTHFYHLNTYPYPQNRSRNTPPKKSFNLKKVNLSPPPPLPRNGVLSIEEQISLKLQCCEFGSFHICLIENKWFELSLLQWPKHCYGTPKILYPQWCATANAGHVALLWFYGSNRYSALNSLRYCRGSWLPFLRPSSPRAFASSLHRCFATLCQTPPTPIMRITVFASGFHSPTVRSTPYTLHRTSASLVPDLSPIHSSPPPPWSHQAPRPPRHPT
jgi:hypothetical protein